MGQDDCTVVANPLLELMCTGVLTKMEMTLVLLIMRLTVGCYRETCYFKSHAHIGRCVGTDRANVPKIVNALVEKKVIFADSLMGEYSINWNFSEWIVELTSKFDSKSLHLAIQMNMNKTMLGDNIRCGVLSGIIQRKSIILSNEQVGEFWKLVEAVGEQRRPDGHVSTRHHNHLESLRAALLGVNSVCYICDQRSIALILHHKHYNTWKFETLSDVVLLCGSCHSKVTYYSQRGKQL